MYAACCGCDYLPRGIPGIGKVRAEEILLKLRRINDFSIQSAVAQCCDIIGDLKRKHPMIAREWIAKEYTIQRLADDLTKVLTTYRHQVIYDIDSKELCPLSHGLDDPCLDSIPPSYCGTLCRPGPDVERLAVMCKTFIHLLKSSLIAHLSL